MNRHNAAQEAGKTTLGFEVFKRHGKLAA